MAKLGLVFSGGGGKGAYEIGVWKALKEFGIDKNVEAVAGTSVGGLNGALFVNGDYDAAESLWLNIAPEKIMVPNKDSLAKQIAKAGLQTVVPGIPGKAILAIDRITNGEGIFNQSGLSELIEESNACDGIHEDSLPFHVCALSTPKGELKYPLLNDKNTSTIKKWLLASAAIPVVFDAVKINGKNYYDGGVLPGQYSDNTPYKVLIEEYDCTHIINVFLSRTPDLIEVQKAYPGINFWNIVPTEAFDGGLAAPLVFTSENAAKLIDCGYQDVIKILEQFKAFQDDEDRYLDAVFELGQSNSDFKEQIELSKELRTSGSDSNIEELSYEDVIDELSCSLDEQERDLINDKLDDILDEMKVASSELLDEAFTSISTLASTEGRINEQYEEGVFGRLLSSVTEVFTGTKAKQQAGINWDLNRAIYANQQLIQKLNKKQMLSMEVMVSLSNKTNYLLTHVNHINANLKLLESQSIRNLQLMKAGVQRLAAETAKQFSLHDQRLERLERADWIDNWYHEIRGLPETLPVDELLMEVTTSFYNATGRDWQHSELQRYVNALDDLGIKNTSLTPSDLLSKTNLAVFSNRVDVKSVFPIVNKKACSHPTLKAIQEVLEEDALDDVLKEIAQDYALDLGTELKAKDIGLELLYSLKGNDRRTPVLTTTLKDKELLEHSHHGKQAECLAMLNKLIEVNDRLVVNESQAKDLSFLKEAVETFKVVVPIIGKFSAGKSTLLNAFLGKDYLSYAITPETAFATELRYSESEYAIVHFMGDKPSIKLSLDSFRSTSFDNDVYFSELYINNTKLKHRADTVLVDMPGFDSNSVAHTKAISRYLERGDSFVCLIPSNVPFDATIMNQLVEIEYDYGKDISVLISKSSRRSPSQLNALTEELRDSLQLNIEIKDIGHVESKGTETDISDFEHLLDMAAKNFDQLLGQRYLTSIDELKSRQVKEIEGFIQYASSNQGELEQEKQALEEQFKSLKKSVENSLFEMEMNLCSKGKEQIVGQVQQALNEAQSQLLNAARTNTVNVAVSDIVRPILQHGLNELIQQEMNKLETSLEQVSAEFTDHAGININIPQEEKSNFSVKGAVIAAGIGWVVAGPLGGVISGLLKGLWDTFFGGNDAQEKEEQLRNEVQNRVIPQIISSVIQFVEAELRKAAQDLRAAVMNSFSEEQKHHKEKLEQLIKQMKEDQTNYETKVASYTEALNAINQLKLSGIQPQEIDAMKDQKCAGEAIA